VAFGLGVRIDIRPSKVVAGMEPEATNLFLQQLARVSTDPNVDRAAAVQRVLDGETTAPKVARKDAAPPAATVAPPPAAPPPLPLPPMPEPAAPAPALAPEPPSGLSTFQSEMPNLDDGGGGGKAERPRTARRQPPKVSSNTVKVEHAAPKGAEADKAHKHIIAEGARPGGDDDDDDDDGIVIVNDAGDVLPSGGLLKDADGAAHTKIVKNLLDAQKDLEQAGSAESRAREAADAKGGGGAAGGGGIILGRKKSTVGAGIGAGIGAGDRARTKTEIDKLRQDIQALCQSTNPLGKSLEYVEEVRAAPRRACRAPGTRVESARPCAHVRAATAPRARPARARRTSTR
jgi:TRAF3-interacting protein 1